MTRGSDEFVRRPRQHQEEICQRISTGAVGDPDGQPHDHGQDTGTEGVSGCSDKQLHEVARLGRLLQRASDDRSGHMQPLAIQFTAFFRLHWPELYTRWLDWNGDDLNQDALVALRVIYELDESERLHEEPSAQAAAAYSKVAPQTWSTVAHLLGRAASVILARLEEQQHGSGGDACIDNPPAAETGRTPDPPEPKQPVKVDFSRWGIGHDGKIWWLFYRTKVGRSFRWETRGKIDIPSGNPNRIAMKLLQEAQRDHGRAAISKSEMHQLFVEDNRGRTPQALQNSVVTPALAKLRLAIREALQRIISGKVTADPLYWDRKSQIWQSKLIFGVAEKDDHGKLTLDVDADE